MSDNDVTIRTAAPADFDAIVAIAAREFKAVSVDAMIETMLGGVAWIQIKGASLRHELTANPNGCFVAVTNDNVVGYVTTSVNPTASRGVILNLAVSSACRGKGIGRQMVQRALDYFRSQGLHHAKIETLVNNEAGQHLYTSFGFREVARQIHYAMPLNFRQAPKI